MKKEKMVKTKEFKELVKDFMIMEAYGACDIRLHYEQHGLNFKPRATDSEIEIRINYFSDMVTKINKLKKNKIMTTEQIIARTEVGTDGDNGLKNINKLLSEGWKIEGVNSLGNCLEYLLEREIIIRPLSIDIPNGDDFFNICFK